MVANAFEVSYIDGEELPENYIPKSNLEKSYFEWQLFCRITNFDLVREMKEKIEKLESKNV